MAVDDTVSRPTLMDVLSGFCLFSIGTIGLAFYIFITVALTKLSSQMKGFLLLISDAFSNFGQIIMFGIWPGIIIMFQYDPLPKWTRFPIAILNNGFWFAMSEHYGMVAFTRLIAVAKPFWFKSTLVHKMYHIIAVTWLVAFAQSVYLTTRPWWVMFYYIPGDYGFSTHEWVKYIFGGPLTFWTRYNRIVTSVPFLLYFAAAAVVFKHRHQQAQNQGQADENRVETRLIIPCFVNQAFYFGGSSILFDLLVIGNKGLWGKLILGVFFTINSAINAVLLVTMSTPVKEKVMEMIGKGNVSNTITVRQAPK